MRRSSPRCPPTRRLTAAGTLIVALAAAPVGACGARPVSPLPVETAGWPTTVPPWSPSTAAGSPTAWLSPTPSLTPPPAPATTRRVRTPPTRPRPTSAPTTPTPAATSACLGAVRVDIDVQTEPLELQKSFCLATGAVLRLRNIGPGVVRTEPASLVSSSYEGGVVDLRFVRPGTVTVTVPQNGQNKTITVVVR